MERTTSEHALESLRLQHQHHLRQQELILEKRLRIERAQNAQKSLENRTNQSSQTDETDFLEDRLDGVLDPLGYCDNSLYRTMNQTDTLLAFLHKRKTVQESNILDAGPAARVSFTKDSKDDKAVIEELRVHNQDLQRHVHKLVKELDWARKEIDQLRRQLQAREQLKHVASEPMFSPDHFTPFDLPPLEMPTLNLDILKEGLGDDTFSDSDIQ